MSLNKPISCVDFCNMEFEDRDGWWGNNGNPLFGQQFKMMVTGRGGSKKSFLVVGMGLAMSSDDMTKYVGQDCVNGKKVLYMNFEINEHSMQQRLRSMTIDKEFPNFHIINSFDFNFENTEDRRNLLHYVAEERYDIVIFDCMYKMHTLEENDESDMKKVVNFLDMFIAHGISVILVHHNCKNSNNERGSGLIFDWCDTVLGIKNDVLYFNKTRHAETPEKIKLHMNEDLWFMAADENDGRQANASKIDDDTISNILRRENVTQMAQHELGAHIKELGIASEWAIKKYSPKDKIKAEVISGKRIFSFA